MGQWSYSPIIAPDNLGKKIKSYDDVQRIERRKKRMLKPDFRGIVTFPGRKREHNVTRSELRNRMELMYYWDVNGKERPFWVRRFSFHKSPLPCTALYHRPLTRKVSLRGEVHYA